MIGSFDHHLFQKIGIDPVRRMKVAGPQRLINRLQPYQAATAKRIVEGQFVDAAHQRQVLRALTLGRVIERGAADLQQAALMAQARTGVGAADHGPAFPPAHRLAFPGAHLV